MIGRLADGWIPSSGFMPPERLTEMHERIDETAQTAGRKPSEVRRIYTSEGRSPKAPTETSWKVPSRTGSMS